MTTYAEGAAYTLEHPGRPALVVALHGLTGTRAQPLALLEGFDEPRLGILAPDLRAHGDTDDGIDAAELTPDQLASDVEELMRHLGLGTRALALLGVSMGATVALQVLRRGVLDVLACVFVRPAHGAEPASHLQVNTRIAAWLQADPGTALERLTASPEYLAVAEVSARAAASLRDKVTKAGSAERAARLVQGSEWIAIGATEQVVDPPLTLIVAAEDDPQHPVAVAETWHARIARSELTVLPGWDRDPARHVSLARSTIQGFLSSVAATLGARA